MSSPLRERAVVTGYIEAVSDVRQAVDRQVRAIWAGAGSWRDADVRRLVTRIVPLVQGGQLQVANLTAGYVAQLAALDGITARPPGVDRDDVLNVRGVDPREVYARPATEMYTKLAQGQTFAAALSASLTRLASLAATDLQLARTHQARRSFGRAGYQYTIRIPKGKSCALCLIAATQRYHVTSLLPIHPGCDCGQDRIKANADPGQVLDPDQLEAVHRAVVELTGTSDRGGRVPDYRDLIEVREHGEYGPTLTWRNQEFTGPTDI